MPNFVPDEGRKDAKIVLIGEAPGSSENDAKRPFVGASGAELVRWWKPVGLQRSDFYIMNVYPYQPPGNDLSRIPANELATWAANLHERLSALSDPWVIVPTGNTALKALLGKDNITKHRGSIYGYDPNRRGGTSEDNGHGTIKVIPTIHPAATFRERSYVRRCVRDWERIAGDLKFRDLRLPQREHYIQPNLDDLRVYAEGVRREAQTLSIDIETPGGVFSCIGFSYDPAFSFTVPTLPSYWGAQWDEANAIIAEMLACDVEKVFQNGLFDNFYLSWLGYMVHNWQWDTLCMHHALCPNDSHDLAYMASVDTREPYWKDEAKDPQEMKKYTKSDHAFWTYNGKDVAVTQELSEIYHERLGERIPFYQRHYRDMFQPLLRMSLEGIRSDELQRERQHTRLLHDCVGILEALHSIAGEPLQAKKGLSPTKVTKYLYQTLGLPTQKNKGKVTTDETALRTLMRKYNKAKEPCGLILDFRRKSKLAQFMAGGIADEDGRVRCEYRFTTETGRLASRANPRGTGTNLQNQDHECLNIYVPDEGHIFMGIDLSQAEDRWVKVIAYANRHLQPDIMSADKWEEVLWRARAKPWENDEHWRAAQSIYHLSIEQMDKGIHRQLGKRTRHALNYGMHAARHAEECMKVGLDISEKQAEQMLKNLMLDDPYIGIYQWAVRKDIMAHKKLINTWGREYDFTYDRLDDEAYRRGYAFGPQSEVADQTNQNGVIYSYWHIRENGLKSRLRAQKHDEVLFSVEPDEAWELYRNVLTVMELSRIYKGVELSVPGEVWLGRNWGEKRDFKMPPSREEFEAVVKELANG